MKEIKLLSNHIEDELEDAETYARLAMEYRESDPEMSALFYKLSNDEMTHMDLLHKSVVNHILDYKREHGEPPAAMQAVYDHLHKRFMDKAMKITTLQSRYKK